MNNQQSRPTILGQIAMGFAIGTFIFPVCVLVALLLGAIDWSNKGKRGKQAVIVAFVGFIVNIVLSALLLH